MTTGPRSDEAVQVSSRPLTRRHWLGWAAATVAGLVAGCSRSTAPLPGAHVISGPGSRPGRLRRPRALAVSRDGRLYVADMTDRIQVFSAEGQFLYLWHLPDFNVDGPTGLDVDRQGNVVITDTHLYRILVCDSHGAVVASIGGIAGDRPGEFTSLRHVAVHPQGGYVTSESGGLDRIQVFDPSGVPIRWWGRNGSGPGEFRRPEAVEVVSDGRILVADSCNHRIQVFTSQGELLGMWGSEGPEPGQLRYPYDITVGPDGLVYVCEYGNHRIQRFTLDGEAVDVWGSPGTGPGCLWDPWAVAVSPSGDVFVADSGNHRIQRFRI